MQLTLVRHGEASPAVNGNDMQRPLTVRGHQQAEQTGDFLKDVIQPEVFIVSPFACAGNAATYQGTFSGIPVLICDKIKPDDNAKDAIEWLSNFHTSRLQVVNMNVVAHIAEQLTHESFNPICIGRSTYFMIRQ